MSSPIASSMSPVMQLPHPRVPIALKTAGNAGLGFRYARCDFRVTTTGSEPTLIRAASKVFVPFLFTREQYAELGALWATDEWVGSDQQPVVVTRTREDDSHTSSNPFGATFCYGAPQLVLEVAILVRMKVQVMENGHIAALTLFQSSSSS